MCAVPLGVGPKPRLRGDPSPIFPRKGWFGSSSTIFSHFPQEILAAASDAKAKLRRPLRRILGLLAVRASWIVQLRVGMAAVAP